MRNSRWMLALLCSLAIVPASADDATADWGTPVPDSELEVVRGGFDTGNGLVVSLGVERLVSINGNVVASTQFNIADMAHMSSAEAQFAREALQPFLVVQNGPGNSFSADAMPQLMSALLIQNSVNDQLIRSQTTINTTVNTLSALKSMNLEATLREALANAVGAH
jgi:hypothetical protein